MQLIVKTTAATYLLLVQTILMSHDHGIIIELHLYIYIYSVSRILVKQ